MHQYMHMSVISERRAQGLWMIYGSKDLEGTEGEFYEQSVTKPCWFVYKAKESMLHNIDNGVDIP